jgi:hypothetical protein
VRSARSDRSEARSSTTAHRRRESCYLKWARACTRLTLSPMLRAPHMPGVVDVE